ncbi:acyl carrier protein [Paenibacillus sp. HB172176]|uniref:acyl carrier protein n=1 Tax=Paenibacillus sp. HB172176 TaxID=2493690 RepID=UPI001439F635|nr:acyl carrier protein [Paenibacillus sp. HB172176]
MSTRSEMAEEIAARVKQMMKIQQNIGLDEDLQAMGFNSMDLMTLAIDLEDHYKLDFIPEELLFKNFATIRKIVNLVESK